MTVARVFVAISLSHARRLVHGLDRPADPGVPGHRLAGRWSSPTATSSSSSRCSASWRWPPSICPPSSSRDLYWRHLPYGKLRFLVGLVVVAALSYGVARWLDKPPRSIWEVSPGALAADKGDPAAAGGSAHPACACADAARTKAQSRLGLSKFARTCRPTPCSRPPRRWRRSATASPPRRSSPARSAAGCRSVRRRGRAPAGRTRRTRSLSATYDASSFCRSRSSSS